MTETAYVIEVPTYGSVPLVPDKDRVGHMRWLLDEAEWTPLHFTPDGDWAQASEQPPCPPTLFPSREEAKQKLRNTQHRDEVLAAARSGPVSPYLRAGRVAEASTLQVKSDFAAEIEAEKRGVRLELLRVQAERATAALEAEESELAQIRAEAKAELENLKNGSGSSDWAALGGLPRIQSRRRADGSEVFRARVGGETSPTFEDVSQATAWRDERSTDDAPPPPVLIGRSEGSRPADD